MKNIIVIVPSLSPTGPIKGAIGLVNGLDELGVSVTLISLKKGPGSNCKISKNVNIFELGCNSNLSIIYMLYKIKKIVNKYEDSKNIAIISQGFSADLVNLLLRVSCKKIASIRGDLKINYSLTYGYLGEILANLHYFILKYFDANFALNEEMKMKLIKNKDDKVEIIPNFLNEIDYENISKVTNLSPKKNIIFVGSICERKQPFLLLKTVKKLLKKGLNINLIFIGDGPLKDNLISEVKETDNENIKILGFKKSPINYVAKSDILVLPSLSEGTPRAVMEALYIGVPCVMRNLSTNDALVVNGINGCLFNHDSELEDAIIKCLKISDDLRKENNLLSKQFSQEYCCNETLRYLRNL